MFNVFAYCLVPALSAPCSIWCDHHLPAGIGLCVVHQQLQRFPLMGLDQWEEVFRLQISNFELTVTHLPSVLRDHIYNQINDILHLATVDLHQQCSHCVAEALPMQPVSWLPHPTGKKLQIKAKIQITVWSISLASPGLDEAHQNVPDVLISSLVAAEANTGPQQARSSPHVTGHHVQLAHPHGFSAVHLHLHSFLHVGFQKLLQHLIFFVLVNSIGRTH